MSCNRKSAFEPRKVFPHYEQSQIQENHKKFECNNCEKCLMLKDELLVGPQIARLVFGIQPMSNKKIKILTLELLDILFRERSNFVL